MPKEYSLGTTIPAHRHERGQLVYACSGLMELRTDSELWIIPPMRGVWLPPDTGHSMHARTPVSLRTLYLDVSYKGHTFPHSPLGIIISPLLRELLIRASTFPIEYEDDSYESRVIRLIVDEIKWTRDTSLRISIAADRRIQKICNRLIENPSDNRQLEDWGREVGATKRTLTRLFTNEFGTTFIYWRQQLRIMNALPRLLQGESVTDVSQSLGYTTPSAFTVMFKRITGRTPRQYIKEAKAN
ncbi:AraC family transcriptional regulator [Halomonas sp. WWR20]